jgi:integrase
LPSGRYQARYPGPDGVDRPAPGTFASKTAAEKWLVKIEAQIHDDQWLDPDLGYRALVLLAVFGSLRWGELAALRRRDVDVQLGTVRVERSLSELPGGGYLFGPPKSAAGRRVVVLPAAIKPALADHLAAFTVDHPDALVFTSPAGMPLRPSNFRRRVWYPALAEAGLARIHFHDLRHTGNAFTAATGATLRELMDRMGHSSTRAALIYLHGNDDRQRMIADGLSKLAQQELGQPEQVPRDRALGERSGTGRARKAGNR